MTSLTIDRVRARYRLPPSDDEGRRRLNGVLERALGPTLEASLAGTGIRDGELVCIRRLDVSFHARLTRTEAALAGEWAQAFAAELRRSVADGTAVVVRYPSPAAALLDLVRRVARGDLTRAWAWRSLGLWEGPGDAAPRERARGVVAALSTRPELAAPVLERSAEDPVVRHFLFGRVARLDWTRLAAAALAATGLDPVLARPVAGPAPVGKAGAGEVGGRGRSGRPEGAVTSRLARAAGAVGVEAATAPAVAALALLATEPGLLHGHRDPGTRIAAVARTLVRPVSGGAGSAPGAGRAPTGRGGRRAATPPADARRPGTPDVRPGGAPYEDRPPAAPPAGEAEGDGVDGRAGGEAARGTVEAPTAYGGLLFFLNLVGDPAGLAPPGPPPSPSPRSPRWTLNRLGARLAGAPHDDPAVLAFCGTGPGESPPARTGPAPTAAEDAALDAAARRLRHAACAALDGAEGEAGRITRELVRRDAVVAADPGWIEVRFSLRDLAPDVRRAGLDLDPGWLPWLGVVVRFAYV
jgi:hypothetical protein